MNTKGLMVCAIVGCMGLTVMAQQENRTIKTKKLDVTARRQVAKPTRQLTAISIQTTDAHALARRIQADGYHAMAVTPSLVTANVPAAYLEQTLQHQPQVKRVRGSHKMRLSLDKARTDIGVDNIREGEEFETPYTGKGVIVGMIDTGFKFNHISFQDSLGLSRFKWVWERQEWSDGVETQPTDSIPQRGDGSEYGEGHATHTTGIAAGSVIAKNNYSGIAPEADIVAISSSLEDAELLEDLAYIADYAHQQGQPCVINLSLGTVIGPHDGLSPFDQLIDSISLARPGQAVVLAAGNSGGDKVHASHTFTEDGERVALAIRLSSEYQAIDLWCDQTDSLSHMQVEGYIGSANAISDTLSLDDEETLLSEICDFNKKQHFMLVADEHFKSSNKYAIMVVTGTAGTSFNAWCDDYSTFSSANFAPLELKSLKGDSEMSVGGYMQCAEQAFCVANYVTKSTIHSLLMGNINLATWGIVSGAIGSIEGSSSRGPIVSDHILKPDVAAPGTVIAAPVDATYLDFTMQMLLVDKINVNGDENYFAAYPGTSMSSPMVAGTMALWLQANPKLTNNQLHDIIRQTSRHDEKTGDEPWNARWGYGKLDAYNGLKMALELAESSGVPGIMSSEQPVSLKKEGHLWRVLFNNAEHYADIQIINLQGQVVMNNHLSRLQRGQEEILSFEGLAPGVYIVNVRTAKSSLTRKLSLSY